MISNQNNSKNKKMILNDSLFKNKLLLSVITICCIHNNVLHATNNGFDRDEKPSIPFLEFLQDVAQAVNKENFIKLTDDMLNNDEDIKLLTKKYVYNAFKRYSINSC